MIKSFNKLKTDANFLNLMKNICKKPTDNTLLYGKKLETFSLRPGTSLLSPLLFSITLEILANANRQENEIEGL